jgi:peptidoglycan/LPS O-acetylase OafA/YrhL
MSGTGPPSPSYRPDVDGLRAVAIIPVVLFHLGLALFSGGFVGVDVFFVISGYLITSLIHSEMLAGRFSVLRFYERRVRRIFPAFFLVMAACIGIAATLLLPPDLRAFSMSLAATTLFSANLFFWRTAGYFDGAAEGKPFLHAWSLSVEEQFYIAFPLILLLTVRFARSRTKLVLAVLAVISFAASAVAVHAAPKAAFYLPQFRAWQLLLGALLAVGAVPRPSSRTAREVASAVGLGLIGYAVVTLSEHTPFPGVNALYPSVGAALIIYSGTGGASSVNRVLSLRPVVFVGLISYSLYLWHWPLIVFSRYFLVRDLSSLEMATVVTLSVTLAALSWRFIEAPFRGKGGILSRPQLFGASAVTMLAFVTVGLLGYIRHGFPSRFSPEVVQLAAPADEPIPFHNQQCFGIAPARVARGELCRLGSGPEPSFLLWGDSHALALAPAVEQIARSAGRSGLLAASAACPPLIGVERFDQETARSCRQVNAAVTELLERRPEIRTVVLAGRWALNAEGTRYGTEGGAAAALSPEGIGDNHQVFRAGLERTLRFLSDQGKEVVFLTQVPEVGWAVPSVLARSRIFDRRVSVTGPSKEEYQRRQSSVVHALDDLAGRFRFRVVDCAAPFCVGPTCQVVKDGRPLYRDEHHPSVFGSHVVAAGLHGIL